MKRALEICDDSTEALVTKMREEGEGVVNTCPKLRDVIYWTTPYQLVNPNRCGGLREKTSNENNSTDQSYHERKALKFP
jgi:hypothetical protein